MKFMLKQLNKQNGGTLLGFIAGLVVGLTIAVIVAFTISKTPVPFLSKADKADKPADSGAVITADPNKPMYGNKDAVRQAARDIALEHAPEAADTSVPPTTSPTPPTLAVKAAETKSPDSTTLDAKWIYYLQAGAFHNQADAESAKARLALQGFEASVQERPSDAGTLYRVRLGPFDNIDAMNRIRSKLTEGGMDVAVVRVAR